MTQPYATARVEAELDFGDLEEQLRSRIERATQLAARVAQKHLEKIATVARRVARDVAKDFDDAGRSIATSFAAMEQIVSQVFKRLERSFSESMRAMQLRAKTAATAIRAELARIDNVTVRLTVDSNTVGVRQAHQRLQSWLNTHPLKVKLEVGEGAGGARTARDSMEAWLATHPLTVRVSLHAVNAMQELRALHRIMQAWLIANPLTVRLTVNHSVLQQLMQSLTQVGNTASSGARGMSSLVGMVGRVGSAAASAGKYIGIAGAAVVGLAGAAPAIAALVSALASVGVAAGAAGVALAAAGAMGIGTLKVGISGIGDAFKAMGQSASGGGADAASQLKAVESAQYNLTKAVREEKDAQKGVGDARKDALRNLQDLNDELGESALSEKDAALSLREAKRDLATGTFANADERDRAVLRVEQAEFRLQKTRKDGNRLQQDVNEANKKGVNGSDEVVAAQQRLEDSTRAVKQARDALNEAMNPKSAGGKDPMAEALAKLSPNARAFVLAVQGLKPAWDAVKNSVQDKLFDGLAGRVSALGSTYLPMLKASMGATATAFNEGATGIANFLQSGQGISVMSTLLGSSSTLAGNLGKGLAGLVPGFAAIGASATNVFAKMSGGMGGIADKWSQQMVAMQQDGRMDKIIESAVEVAKQLGAVLADVGGIIKGVFTAANSAGSGFMGTLGQTLDRLNEWVNSFEGQQALTSFFQAMSAAVSAILPIVTQLLGIIGGTVAPALASLITAIAPAIQSLVGALGQGLSALAPAMAPLGAAIASIATALGPVLPVLGQLITTIAEIAGPLIGSLAQALGPVLTAVGQALIPVFDALKPALAPLGQAFQAIGGALVKLAPVLGGVARILATVLAQAITAVAPIIAILADVLGKVFEALTPLIEPLLQLVMTAMKPMIMVVQQLAPILTKIGGIFADIVTTLVSQGLVPIIQQLAKYWGDLLTALMPLLPPLMELVGALLPLGLQLFQALLPIILQLVTWFTSLATKAITGLVVPALNVLIPIIVSVVGFITDLVTWVSNALGAFADWSKGIGQHVTDIKDKVVLGLGLMLDWIKDLPSKIGGFARGMFDSLATAAKSTFNWIADIWNRTMGRLKFSVPSWVPGIGGKSWQIPEIQKLASGGRIGKARRGSDGKISGPGSMIDDLITGFVGSVPRIQVSNDEMVMSGLATRRNYPLLAAMNKGWDWRKILPGRATGGTVALGNISGEGITSAEQQSMWDAVRTAFPDAVLSSATRTVQTEGHPDYHNAAKAVDLSGSPELMSKIAQWIASNYPDSLELIHGGFGHNIKDGKDVGDGVGFYGSDTMQGHYDHVHWALGHNADVKATPNPDGKTPSLTAGTTTPTASTSTPIGSGIDGGTSGSGSSPSWGNSGGGSKYNSAADAKRGGLVAVWVENWPSSMGTPSVAPTGDINGTTPGTTAGGSPSIAPGASTTVPTLSASSSKDDVAKAIIAQGRKRGYSDEQIKAILATAMQESGLQPGADGGDQGIGGALGIFQQGNSYGAREDRLDPNKAIDAFYSRLDTNNGKTGDIWEKVVGVQQHGGAFQGTGGDHKYMGEIKSQQDAAGKLFDANKGATPSVAPQTPTTPAPKTDTPTPGSPGDNSELTKAQQRLSTATTAYTDAETKLSQAVKDGADPATLKQLRAAKAKAKAEKDLAQKAVNAAYDGSGTGTPTPTPSPSPTPTKVKSETMPFGKPRADQWWRENELTLHDNLRAEGNNALKSLGGEFFDMFGLKGLFDKGFDTTVAGLSKDGMLVDRKTTPEQKIIKFAETVIFQGVTPTETKQHTTAGMSAVNETLRSG